MIPRFGVAYNTLEYFYNTQENSFIPTPAAMG